MSKPPFRLYDAGPLLEGGPVTGSPQAAEPFHCGSAVPEPDASAFRLMIARHVLMYTQPVAICVRPS
jgi:hypothetical protein